MKENDTWCLICRKRCGFGDPVINAIFGLLLSMIAAGLTFFTVVLIMSVV